MLYNPTLGANIMSASFVSAYFGNEPISPSNKCLRIAPRINLKGRGVMHNMSMHHNNVKMALDFHVFDITDFDILIGHPLEKLFLDPPKIGDLNVKLGRDVFTIPITRAKNSVAESLPHLDLAQGSHVGFTL